MAPQSMSIEELQDAITEFGESCKNSLAEMDEALSDSPEIPSDDNHCDSTNSSTVSGEKGRGSEESDHEDENETCSRCW
jgi:hypothetical protein